MKVFILACVLAMTGLISTNLAMADPAQGSGQFGPAQSQNLDGIKQRIEQRIQDHISKMQSVLTCVQNAQERQALRQCLPRRGSQRRGQFGADRSQQGQP